MAGSVIPYEFTPLPKAYLRLFYGLSNPAKDLLMFLAEKILGWHKDQKAFSNGYVCKVTEISETGLRRARKELEALGLLRCGVERVAGRTRVLYRLLIPGGPAGPTPTAAPQDPDRQRRRGTPSTGGTHVKNMETSSKKEQHQGQAVPTSEDARNEPSAPPVPPPPTPDDVPSIPSSKTKEDETKGRLVARLESLGVHRSMSRRLVESKPVELILAALNRLPFRQAKNPAAYLVRELLDGGYSEPAPVVVVPTREEVHERRKAEQREEEARRDREARDLAAHVDGVLARLAPEERLTLLEEARGRLGAWAARFALDDGNPIIRGALCDLVLERWPMAMVVVGVVVS